MVRVVHVAQGTQGARGTLINDMEQVVIYMYMCIHCLETCVIYDITFIKALQNDSLQFIESNFYLTFASNTC